MSWIKIQKSLPKSNKVLRLAEVLRVRRAEALGLALDWFCWLDEQCTDGSTGMTPRMVNEVIGHKRFAEGLVAIGWAELDSEGRVCVVDFDAHNGQSAKARAMTAKRMAAGRLSKKRDAESVTESTKECEKRDAESVTETQQVRHLDKNIHIDNKGCRLSNATLAGGAEPAPTPIKEDEDGFERWLSAVAGAHPSARMSRSLAKDVDEAARDAYKRCPAAEQEAELLGAYFASRQSSDRHGLVFYRPTGQRKYFTDLEDVICHARRWAREFNWKGKSARVSSDQRCERRAGAERRQGMASDAQVEDFHRALRDGVVWQDNK